MESNYFNMYFFFFFTSDTWHKLNWWMFLPKIHNLWNCASVSSSFSMPPGGEFFFFFNVNWWIMGESSSIHGWLRERKWGLCTCAQFLNEWDLKSRTMRMHGLIILTKRMQIYVPSVCSLSWICTVLCIYCYRTKGRTGYWQRKLCCHAMFS